MFAFPPAPVVTVPVEGGSRFPVRRIFCVGRNYADHAAEMGHDTREPPFFFSKPSDAVVPSGSSIPYPPATADLHYEGELVVAIGPGAGVFGFAAGNDLTRRDLQAEAKASRRPWDMSKGFDRSAVIGALVPSADGVPPQGRIRCLVDGEIRQDGNLSDMIWPVAAIIAYLSRLVELRPGDLIFTGTPAGVGAIRPGQTCSVEIEGLDAATVTLA